MDPPLPKRSTHRAGRLLDGRLYLEGGRADVLKAEVLHGRSGPGLELAHPPGLGGLHELDLGASRRPGLPDPHVPVEQFLLAEVLQPLGLDEGRSAARDAVDRPRAALLVALWQVGSQAQLLAAEGREEAEERRRRRRVVGFETGRWWWRWWRGDPDKGCAMDSYPAVCCSIKCTSIFFL